MHSSALSLFVLAAALGLSAASAYTEERVRGEPGIISTPSKCNSNIVRLVATFCSNIKPGFCEAQIEFLEILSARHSSADPVTILHGECCRDRRCSISTLRSLCCLQIQGKERSFD